MTYPIYVQLSNMRKEKRGKKKREEYMGEETYACVRESVRNGERETIESKPLHFIKHMHDTSFTPPTVIASYL